MATATLGQAVLHTRLDNRQFVQGLEQAEAGTRRTFAGIDRRAERTARAFETIGRRMSLAITAPITGVALFAAKAASDADEIASKFSIVFGQTSKDVEAFAETLGRSVGRSQNDLKRALSTFQDTFVPLGFAREEAAKLSEELTALSIDVASFNNAADADVLRDFQSALVGNTETVRKYGVIINETNTQQEALKLGLAATKKEITDQDKVLARYSLLLKGTGDAQGDAARTASSAANSYKAFRAALSDSAVVLGREFLPEATKVIRSATDLIRGFSDLDERTRSLIVRGAALAAGLGPLAIAIGKVTQGVAALGKLTPMLSTLVGPTGLVLATATAFGVLARSIGAAANEANRLAQGQFIAGISAQAEAVRRGITALEQARDEFILNQSELVTSGKLTVEELRASVERYDQRITSLREQLVTLTQAAESVDTGVRDTAGAVDTAAESFKGLEQSVKRVAVAMSDLQAVRASEIASFGQADALRRVGRNGIRPTTTIPADLLPGFARPPQAPIPTLPGISGQSAAAADLATLGPPARSFSSLVSTPEARDAARNLRELGLGLRQFARNLPEIVQEIAKNGERANAANIAALAVRVPGAGPIPTLPGIAPKFTTPASPFGTPLAPSEPLGPRPNRSIDPFGLGNFAEVGGKALDEAALKAGQRQIDAAKQFEAVIAQAAVSFASTLAQGIQTGDTGSIVQGLFGLGGSLASAALGPIAGTLVSGGLGILGSLFAGAFGPSQQEQQAQQAAAERSRSVPAVTITMNVQQDIAVEGSPTDVGTLRQFGRFADELTTSLIDGIERRTQLFSRFARVEASLA